ncbi:hypothetical protein CPT34_13690 [Rhizobium sophoriradicis]|uniref:Post-segregation antitoxin CcdA n=1 Tax=Rhizobium sophoriradicis TaxID=1535245 RepID=A0A2A5KUZ3_9HYPH|nr:hypothetical protein CPT34_13690 [Rhizobium sophoriradicis]
MGWRKYRSNDTSKRGKARQKTSDDETLPRAERERLWRIENAEAIAEQNEYVAKHGLPFAKYRQF